MPSSLTSMRLRNARANCLLSRVDCASNSAAARVVAGVKGQLVEDLAVRRLELVTIRVEQSLSRALRRHDLLGLNRPGLAFVGHFEEQQEVHCSVYSIVETPSPRSTLHEVGPELVDDSSRVNCHAGATTASPAALAAS